MGLWREGTSDGLHRLSIGRLSKGVFERRTSTGRKAFYYFMCLDATTFVYPYTENLPENFGRNVALEWNKSTSGWRSKTLELSGWPSVWSPDQSTWYVRSMWVSGFFCLPLFHVYWISSLVNCLAFCLGDRLWTNVWKTSLSWSHDCSEYTHNS